VSKNEFVVAIISIHIKAGAVQYVVSAWGERSRTYMVVVRRSRSI